jgi:hypothetical protein
MVKVRSRSALEKSSHLKYPLILGNYHISYVPVLLLSARGGFTIVRELH